MFTAGRTLLILGFIITIAAILWLVFGSMEFPRGNTIGDLEYHSRTIHAYIPVVACLVISFIVSLVLWRANRP